MSDETPLNQDETTQENPTPGRGEMPTFDLSLNRVERPIDLVDRMTSILGRACSKHAMRDRVAYAVGVHLIPQGPDTVLPCLAVTLAIPSLEINQSMQGTVILQDMAVSEEKMGEMVSEMLGNLRTARIQQAGTFGQHPNGQPPV